MTVVFFFISSSGRHTSWPRNWSSDVCSSDLQSRSTTNMPAQVAGPAKQPAYKLLERGRVTSFPLSSSPVAISSTPAILNSADRSEERRVGKALRFLELQEQYEKQSGLLYKHF